MFQTEVVGKYHTSNTHFMFGNFFSENRFL